MERTLMLVRHAKAGGGDGGGDAERALSELGYEQCRVVAREMSSMGLNPEVALVSTARRAKQTFNAMAAAAAWSIEPELVTSLYSGYVEEMLAAVRAAPDTCSRLMVVGHEPTTSATAYKLAGSGSTPDAVTRVRRGLPTAGVAVIQVDGPWDSVGLQPTILRWLLTPLA
ncbi:MAG: histidine phosphatase family protein [Bifidobacteriaceae bacterium]|jgi:phosphohistidine phosphatase|nr:histidine phosphatase family protein [Bifidobacteriaceae bacterium]